MSPVEPVSGPAVLVVDDEPVVLSLMQRALAEAGYQVHSASDGLSALALAFKLPSPPAVLVTDLRMEPVDGASLCRLLRQRYPDIRVVFVSGFGPPSEFGELPGLVGRGIGPTSHMDV
jgi:CheY-like chemotaxis protein